MLSIDTFEIKGLWDSKNIEIKMNKNFNFLIGDNGTGKTTAINMLVSILKVDINKLWKTAFSEVVITLSDKEYKQKFEIQVKKGEDENGYEIINLLTFDVDKEENASYLFRNRSNSKSSLVIDEDYFIRRDSKRKIPEKLLESLNSRINLSWLPVSRADSSDIDQDLRISNHNSVDSRLNFFSSEFIKYASMINGRLSDNTSKFQQNVFLSLIDPAFIDKMKGEFKLDVKKEKAGITDAFRTLGIDEYRYKKRIDKTFGRLHSIVSRQRKDKSVDMEDFAYMFNAMRTHDFVEEYYKLKNINEETYKPLSNFVDVLNGIFNGRKEFYISSSNELAVYGSNTDELTLNELSSGEKQMIIILGEALLQDEKECIYIADEPELSLHVAWQEKLVSAITSINKRTQILFATHSPDIVGWLENYTIDMAEVIK